MLWNLVLPSIKALTWFVFFILGSIYSDTSGSIPLHPRRCDVINTCIYKAYMLPGSSFSLHKKTLNITLRIKT